jgi:thioredoxin-related protein
MFKIKTIFTLFVFLSLVSVKGQDIHDLNHSKQFADYLFKTRQYSLAAEEYERIVFLDSANFQNKYMLIMSYRKAKEYNQALKRFNIFFENQFEYMPANFAEEYVRLLLLTKQDSSAFSYLSINKSLNSELKQNYQLAALLLQKKWDDSFNFALKYPVTNERVNAQLHLLAFEAKRVKYKKTAVAAVMSAIVPGSGKFYTKNWKDGIIAMTFVGVNAWQAYRGFKKYGKKSAYGWIFAGLSAGFYFGNIYGSAKSAKKYNKKQENELYQKALHIVLDDL